MHGGALYMCGAVLASPVCIAVAMATIHAGVLFLLTLHTMLPCADKPIHTPRRTTTPSVAFLSCCRIDSTRIGYCCSWVV
jgi:hypothetical protein